MKRFILGFLLFYMAAVGSFAGIGLVLIERKIEGAQAQAVAAVLFKQNVKVLSELRI